MDLNGVMSIIANVPAAIASTVGKYLPTQSSFTKISSRLSPAGQSDALQTTLAQRPNFSRKFFFSIQTRSLFTEHHRNNSHNTQNSSLAFRSQDRNGNAIINSVSKPESPLSPVNGVHVQMETFKSLDRSFEGLSGTEEKIYETLAKIDLEKASEDGTCDVDSQITRKDFKRPSF